MFKYTPISKQLLRGLKKNEILNAEAAKNKADIDYIAMMCDVELETTDEEEVENEYEIQ